MASCPGGHTLKPFSFSKVTLRCDYVGCGRAIQRGETHPRCDECDFDVCNNEHKMATPVRTRPGAASRNSDLESANDSPLPPPPTPAEHAALESEVALLKKQLHSARASGPRTSHSASPAGEEAPTPEPLKDKFSKCLYERVRSTCENWIEPILKKRPGLRAKVLNYLLLKSPITDRKEFSTLQAAAQERYLGISAAVNTILTQGYTAEHSADLVVNEHLSIGTVRNINDRFTLTKDSEGRATKIVLCRPPSTLNDPDADDVNQLTRAMNRAMGIGEKVITCPKPFRSDKHIHDAIYSTFADRTLHLTVPTADGYEGAAFDICDSGRDVLRQAEKDNHLRALASVGEFPGNRVGMWELPLLSFVEKWVGKAKSGKSHF